MKYLGFLLLAVFASCKAAFIDDIKRIEQETNGKIILSQSSRAIGIQPAELTDPPKPTIGKNICQDNVLWFVDLTQPGDTPGTYKVDNKSCSVVVNANTGFCNCALNNCQRSAPTNCPVVPIVDCPTDNEIFPSELKCDEFRVCISNKLETGKCLSGLRYNSREKRCTSGLPCTTVRCASTSPTVPSYAPFKSDPRYVLFCFEGKSIVIQCPEKTAWDKGGCSYECTASGCFADPDTTSDKYYCCAGTRKPFKKTEYSCGTGQVYDETFMKCKPKAR